MTPTNHTQRLQDIESALSCMARHTLLDDRWRLEQKWDDTMYYVSSNGDPVTPYCDSAITALLMWWNTLTDAERFQTTDEEQGFDADSRMTARADATADTDPEAT